MTDYRSFGIVGIAFTLLVITCTFAILIFFTYRLRHSLSYRRTITSNVVNFFVILCSISNLWYFISIISFDSISPKVYTMYMVQSLFYFVSIGSVAANWIPALSGNTVEKYISGVGPITMRQYVFLFLTVAMSIMTLAIAVDCSKTDSIAIFYSKKVYLLFSVLDLVQIVLYNAVLIIFGLRFIAKFNLKEGLLLAYFHSAEGASFLVQRAYKKILRMLTALTLFATMKSAYQIWCIIRYYHGDSALLVTPLSNNTISDRSWCLILDVIPQSLSCICLVWLAKPSRTVNALSTPSPSQPSHCDIDQSPRSSIDANIERLTAVNTNLLFTGSTDVTIFNLKNQHNSSHVERIHELSSSQVRSDDSMNSFNNESNTSTDSSVLSWLANIIPIHSIKREDSSDV